jgi:hypothetical protein
MFCVGYRNGFNEEQDLSRADMIIHHFAEFDWKMLYCHTYNVRNFMYGDTVDGNK